MLRIHVKALFKLSSLIGDPGEARHMIWRSIVGESLHLDSGVPDKGPKAKGYPDPRSTHKIPTKSKQLVTSVTRHVPWASYLLRVGIYCPFILSRPQNPSTM